MILNYCPALICTICLVFPADWIIADMLAIRQGALGHVRYILKDGLKWLPLYGWYFSQVRLPCILCFFQINQKQIIFPTFHF